MDETTATIYSILQASLSQDNATRSAAEAKIHEWESNPSTPGFIGGLIKIAQQVQNVPEVRIEWRSKHLLPCFPSFDTCLRLFAIIVITQPSWQIFHTCSLHFLPLQELRLLAVVVAKNAVGSNWRKTMATREWSHVPGTICDCTA